jgi:hypothetical protein
MDWHYQSGGDPIGPVSEEYLRSLRAMGVVGSRDRVKREDWTEWKEIGEVWPMMVSTAAISGAETPQKPGPCKECGANASGMVELAGTNVCARCEPLAREKVLQGLPLGGGPWSAGELLVMRCDLPLPHCCVKCGEPATTQFKKRLYWHHPALYLALLPGVLPYVVLTPFLRRT